MRHVATVMVPREAFRLDNERCKIFITALSKAGAENIRMSWLSKEEAADFLYDGPLLADTNLLSASKFVNDPIDCIVQEVGTRAKKLMLADMDSTIIRQECIDEIADVLDLKDKVAPITEAAMRGKLDFKNALKERVALLRGITRSQLQTVMDERIEYTDGARTLVKTLSTIGVKTAIVSGGFTFFISQVQKTLGFDFAQANYLLFEEDRLTGQVRDDVLDAQGKCTFLLDLADTMNISSNDVIAVGDGANDIPMMQEAGFSLAFHAKPTAAKAAKGRLNHVCLEGVLFALGIPRKQFHE